MGKVWYVENSWSCDSCGSTTQKGRHTTCRNCGAPKGARVADRIPNPDSAPAVTDPELLRQARAGANWVCEYCGKQERTLNGECRYCAAEREGESSRVRGSHSRRSGEEYSPPKTRPDSRTQRPKTPSISSIRPTRWWGRRRNQLIAGGVALAIAALTWFGIWLFVPRKVETQVTQITWKYTKKLQQRETHHGSSWDDQRPSSHFNDSCYRRQRGTEDCHPHDCRPHQVSYSCRPHDCNCRNVCTDQGNGYSRCHQECSTCYDTCYRTEYDTCYDQCPVYDNWCEYDYYKWPTIETKVTSGHDHNMHWPELETRKKLQHIKTYSRYSVVFTDTDEPEDTWEIKPETAGEFKKYKKGAYWLIKVNRAGSVTPLRELKAEAP